MTAPVRALMCACAVALLAASCGQKGPLTLPEETSAVPRALALVQGRNACDGTVPRV